MLLNLKRIYVHMRSFPQARDVTELLLAMTPSALSELRDRGLLAYHLNDVTGALRDLQTYLKLVEHERDGQGRARRARADLGAREDAAPPRRRAELNPPPNSTPAIRRCSLRDRGRNTTSRAPLATPPPSRHHRQAIHLRQDLLAGGGDGVHGERDVREAWPVRKSHACRWF